MADLTSDSLCNICCVHYNAGLRCCALGTVVEGGNLFAKSGSVAWIVAPKTYELTRSWYCRNDAVTLANDNIGCGDWFIPSMEDLFLGNACRDFWDTCGSSNTSCGYWSTTSYNTTSCSWVVRFSNCANVLDSGCFFTFRNNTYCVRAFRKVFY